MARDEYVSKHTGAQLDEAVEAILVIKEKIPLIEEDIRQMKLDIAENGRVASEALALAKNAQTTADDASTAAKNAGDHADANNTALDELNGKFMNLEHRVETVHSASQTN